MKDLSRIRALRLPFLPPDDMADFTDLPAGFGDVANTMRQSYPALEPSRAFRDALHARLLAEAAWLKDHPAPTQREVALKRSALTAAALLMLGLAALLWQSRRPQPAQA